MTHESMSTALFTRFHVTIAGYAKKNLSKKKNIDLKIELKRISIIISFKQ